MFEKLACLRFLERKRSRNGDLYDKIMKMLEVKAQSGEKALNPIMSLIHRYIENQIARYDALSKSAEDDRTGDWDVLNRIFRKIFVDKER